MTDVRQDCAKRPTYAAFRNKMWFGGDIVIILVGPDASATATTTRSFAHAGLLSQHSDFFQACLRNGWKEAEERIVRLPDLPDESATAFETFQSFLYTGKVHTAMTGEENEPGNDREWARLTNAWILGEVLLSVSFKDAVLDAIVHKMNNTSRHPISMYRSVYKWSPTGCPARKLMVDIAVHRWNESAMSKSASESEQVYLAPFYQSISVALLEWKLHPETASKFDDPSKLKGTCIYHEHGDKPCYKTMF